jgi:hypothetical protein
MLPASKVQKLGFTSRAINRKVLCDHSCRLIDSYIEALACFISPGKNARSYSVALDLAPKRWIWMCLKRPRRC